MKPKLSSKIKMRKDLDGYILYHTSGFTMLINQTSYDILNLCDGNNSMKDITKELSIRYDTEIKTIENDVIEIIDILMKMDFL